MKQLIDGVWEYSLINPDGFTLNIETMKPVKYGISVAYQETQNSFGKESLNGYILNQKQLIERGKELYPDAKIIPVAYSLNVDDITIEWIESKMQEFGIKRNDLIKQLAIDRSSLSLIMSGKRELSKPMRATFFYYFLTYELNRDFREHLDSL